jgi:hypothetical protein
VSRTRTSTSKLTTSTTAFLYTRLPAGLAKKIHNEMNRAGASKFGPTTAQEDDEAYVKGVYEDWLAAQWDDYVSSELTKNTWADIFSPKNKPQTLGYVTKDACPGKGDDIEHIPVPFSFDQVCV